MNTLFPPSFLAAIGRLGLSVKSAPPRAAAGVHLSPRPGASLAFRDYQPYAPGDDLRRVDWAVYGRTRHLFVRRFERPTAVPVFVVVDASGSMRLAETADAPTRYAAAARVAAAVAGAAIESQNPVHLLIADGTAAAAPPRGATGRRGLVRVLAELAASHEPGQAGIADAIAAALPTLAAKGPGVLVVVSDFFEPRGVTALTDALRQSRHRLVLAQITQPQDAEPELDGDYELSDVESGERLQVSATAAAIERYRSAYAAYFAALDEFAATHGARHVKIDAAADTLSGLERLFPGGVLSV